ncbi:MAG: GNAT family N-acetyltransferase [archaeon]|jgi:ribosomal-protein-alanine N-acetyltransferase
MKNAVSLRSAEETDAEFFYNMMQEKDYQKYYLQRLVAKSIEEEKQKIEKYKKQSEKKTRYYFTILFDKQPAGLIDIYKISLEDKRCSIGYGVTSKYWKKGIASKAVKLAIKFAKKQGLHSCEATVDPKNTASKKVLEKNGFKKIGLVKDYYYENKKYWNIELYWKIL